MAVDLTCFDGVIGLANCACPCLDETAPEGYSTSASDLFISELIPLEMLEGAEDCSDPSNPWNLLSDARRRGQNRLLKDIKAGLMQRNQFRREAWKGMIGEKSARDVLTLSTTYAGVRISAPRIKGGYLNITALGGVFNASSLVTVRVYDRFNTQIGGTVQITTVASGHGSQSCNISLPLWVDGAAWPEYFLVYTVDGANYPRKNRMFCPSCSKFSLPTFSLHSPYYAGKWPVSQGWANWLMIGAWGGDTLTDFDTEAENELCGTSEGYMNGLTITGSLTCDPASAVCLDELDFNDPVSMSVAHALNYISAIEAAEKIIRNPEPYRNSAVSSDILKVDIQQWYKDYQTNVDYVTYHANQMNTDCIFCKPKFAMSIESKLP